MATLEELLTEDGFKMRNKLKQGPRGDAPRTSSASFPSHRLGTSRSRIRPVRSMSDNNARLSHSAITEKGLLTESGDSRMSLSALTEKGLLTEPGQSMTAGRRLRSVQEPDGSVFGSLKRSTEFGGISGNNLSRVCSIDESDVKSKSLMAIESMNGKFDERQEKLGYNRRNKNKFNETKKHKGKEPQNLQGSPSFKDVMDVAPVPEMEEGSIKPIISMINRCVNQLIKDESFRLSVHQTCVSSLKSSLVQNREPEVNRVISTLKESIGDVERIITEGLNELELKKSSFKLSVITGLKSVEADDGQTCGIPNSHIAACSHLYLSILYKIQKKDKVSAKHLLQVFCDSPYQARTALLPALWDQLFLPNLLHLKAWYDKEAESIPVTPHMMMKLEFLEKVYNDIVDMGTSQVAAYYKAWLMEDKKGPVFPSISIPFASVPDIVEDANEVVSFESRSSSNSFPSKTMISKRLYESVLGHSKRNIITREMENGKENETDEVESEFGEGKTNVWGRTYDNSMQKDNESQYTTAENSLEYYCTGSQDSVSSSEIRECKKSYLGNPEVEEIKLGNQVLLQDFREYCSVGKCYPQENENGLKLKKLAQAAFQLKVTDRSNYSNTNTVMLSINSPLSNSYQDEITDPARGKLVNDEAYTTNGHVGSLSLKKKSRDILLGDHEENDQDSLLSRIPKEFICPLTGQLLKDPVTLESGYTFELAAIQDRFNQGNRACPVTGQSLNSSPLPGTNIVLKHMINQWIENCFRNSISLTSQSTLGALKQACKTDYELSLLIVEQLLTGFSSKKVKENIDLLISLGGLKFLTGMLELGSFEEKSRATEVLIQCIQADGCCRNNIAMSVSKSSLLELIHSKQVHARTNAASLLIELICLNRRMDVLSFVNGLKNEDTGNTKHELLLCLECSLPEERVLVAVLLLHLDYMEESETHCVYKKEAVKCILRTLECCLSNKKFIANCERALLMLGGHFSYSGEIVIETWLLEKAGYYRNTLSSKDEDDRVISEIESRRREEWSTCMASILLRYGMNPFQLALSKCWKSGNPDLVRMCLVVAAWLCDALPSLHSPAIQLSVFSVLMPILKECLKSDLNMEHRVLASLCLLNFSKILECRLPLISCADVIHDPLKSLMKVTWTAKHLYNDIFEKNL